MCQFEKYLLSINIWFVANVRLFKMNLILWSVSVLVCYVDKGFAQYYSIYPTIYSPTTTALYSRQSGQNAYASAYPGYTSIFSSNALNFGRTPVKVPIYIPEIYSYPTVTYNRYGRLVATNTIRNPARRNWNSLIHCFFYQSFKLLWLCS